MQTKIRAKRTGGSGEEVDLKSSRDGDLRIAQYLPAYAMLVAAGKVFAIDTSGASPVAPQNAIPTTGALWGIYNANPGGGPHLVLLQVGVMSVSGTMGLGLGIVATTGVGAQTALTANYSDTDISCLDGTSKQPNLFLGDTESIDGTQAAWVILATRDQTSVVSVGTGVVAQVDGMIMAPPGGSLYVSVVGLDAGSALFDISFIVAELQLDVA